MTDTLDVNGLPAMSGGDAAAFNPTPTAVAGGGLPPTVPANATTAQMEAAAAAYFSNNPQVLQWVQQQYGYVGVYLASIPELAPIIYAAGLYGWDQAEFDGAVMQTAWWQTTSQAQRNFQELQASDPGEAASQIAQTKSSVLTQAQSLGLSISAADLNTLSAFATTMNLGTDQVDQLLRTYSQGNPQTVSTSFGATATFADQAKQLAGEYAINLAPNQLQGYVEQNAAGTLTADGLQNVFAQQAASMYPWMSESLAQGVTPSQYLSSYASAAASTLGVDASSIDWADPKWQQALLTDQNGSSTQAPVNVGIFNQNLMKNPIYGYQNTQGARDQAYSMANTLLNAFGKVAS